MSETHKNEWLGAALILAASFLYGIMPLFSIIAYQYGSNANTAAFFRFLFCALICAVIVAVSPKLSFRISKQHMREILPLSFFYAVTPILLFSAYEEIGSGLSTTLHFAYPIMVIVITGIWLRAGFHRMHILCMVLCSAGILCFYTPGGEISGIGMVYAIGSGFTFAMYIVFLGKSHLSGVPIFTVTFWLTALSTVQIGIIGAALGKLTFALPWQAHAGHLALAFFSTVLALALFQRGVFMTGGVKASLLSTFEPLTGVMVGLLVYHEVFTARTAIGIVLILLSTVLLVFAGKKQ